MKSSIAIIIRWVFFGTSIIHGPAKGQVDHRIDQCPFELLVTFLLIQAERPARRGGRGGRRFGLLKRKRCFSETMHHFLGWWVVGGGCSAPTRHRPTTARPDRPTTARAPMRPLPHGRLQPTTAHHPSPTTHHPTRPSTMQVSYTAALALLNLTLKESGRTGD